MSQTHTFPAVRATATPWSMALCHRSAILEKQLLLKMWRKSWGHVTRSALGSFSSEEQQAVRDLNYQHTECTDMVKF